MKYEIEQKGLKQTWTKKIKNCVKSGKVILTTILLASSRLVGWLTGWLLYERLVGGRATAQSSLLYFFALRRFSSSPTFYAAVVCYARCNKHCMRLLSVVCWILWRLPLSLAVSYSNTRQQQRRWRGQRVCLNPKSIRDFGVKAAVYTNRTPTALS